MHGKELRGSLAGHLYQREKGLPLAFPTFSKEANPWLRNKQLKNKCAPPAVGETPVIVSLNLSSNFFFLIWISRSEVLCKWS